MYRFLPFAFLSLLLVQCQSPQQKTAERTITKCVGGDCDSLASAPASIKVADDGDRGRFIFPSHISLVNQPDQASASQPTSPIKAPEGMIFVPGGKTRIGSESGLPREQPSFWVEVPDFFLDEHPVTVADFRKFVSATHFKTDADKFGDAGVFNKETKEWSLIPGANWAYPQGPDQPAAPDDHPVTQVSWRDALAYAEWAGKRLVYEIEWEHAARNATNIRSLYPWGDDMETKEGDLKANIWNGRFPYYDNVVDGFAYTSPVGQFGKTPLGLTDMTGNVWEWTADWRSDYQSIVAHTPQLETTEKAIRGGSFLCEPSWCHGYRVSGRSFCTPETSLMHTGFRCAKDLLSAVD